MRQHSLLENSHTTRNVFLSILFFFISSFVHATPKQLNTATQERIETLKSSEKWKQAYKKKQTSIFTKPIKKSGFAAFKAVTTLPYPLNIPLSIIADPHACPKWIDGCVVSGPLHFPEDQDTDYAYALNDLPWPFKNREAVAQVFTEYTESSEGQQTATIYVIGSDKKRENRKKGAVLISDSVTIYTLKSLGPNQTELTWIQHVNPGGSLPGWLVNSKLIDIPKLSIPRMIRLGEKDLYSKSKIISENGKLIDIILGNNDSISGYYKAARLTQ